MGTEPAAVGKHRGHRTRGRSATVAAWTTMPGLIPSMALPPVRHAAGANRGLTSPTVVSLTRRSRGGGAFARSFGTASRVAAGAPGKRACPSGILDRCFPEDRDYEEKEVNMRLALLHPDVAALRRYLVDAGLMTRAAGIYRRARRVDRGRDRSRGSPRPSRRGRRVVTGAPCDRAPARPRPFVYSPATTGSITPKSPSSRR